MNKDIYPEPIHPTSLNRGDKIVIRDTRPRFAHGPVEFISFEPPTATRPWGKVWYKCPVAGTAYAEADKCEFHRVAVRIAPTASVRKRWTPSVHTVTPDAALAHISAESVAWFHEFGTPPDVIHLSLELDKELTLMDMVNITMYSDGRSTRHISGMKIVPGMMEGFAFSIPPPLPASPPPLVPDPDPRAVLHAVQTIVNAAHSEELTRAETNARHWREQCGKLEARLRTRNDAAMAVVLSERAYQKKAGKHDLHVPAEWLTIIRTYHDEAALQWFNGDNTFCLDSIRKIAAVALAAVEALNIPARE